ncbi:hypothetical protein Q8A73_024013 [Channa argus]|nr:hypothetical protein Q8A73_024554 [Channa argus]KAK2872104.1 hypothetical protein Q8A73_024562 [Channa argus]KAK2872144.1 hypothetical protein Q8A73_024537 [Channa argus]KAK2872152.1 hypothetical protein Q8A73_024545 [Channa argus]KAK2873286.1 hypothetical protein Q8A73_024509 [Channa argus]
MAFTRRSDTLIIDTSNALCGPGFLPGLRLSEGRFAINRERHPLLGGAHRGWGSRRRKSLRPPKCRPPGCPVSACVERRVRMSRARLPIRRDDPLNLSILLSGGKETNQDSLSSGERRGKSPAPNPRPTGGRGKCGVRKTACPVSLGGLSPSDRGSARGRCEAGNGPRRAGVRSSRSRVVWECSPKDGRTVAEDPLVGPPPGAGWPSPGAFPSRRCAATGSGSAWKGRAEVAGGLGRQLLPLPAPRRFLGPWTKCSLRPLSPRGGTGPPAPGATVDRGGLSSVRLNRVASPGRGSAHAKKAPGVCGDVGNPPDPS